MMTIRIAPARIRDGTAGVESLPRIEPTAEQQSGWGLAFCWAGAQEVRAPAFRKAVGGVFAGSAVRGRGPRSSGPRPEAKRYRLAAPAAFTNAISLLIGVGAVLPLREIRHPGGRIQAVDEFPSATLDGSRLMYRRGRRC